MQHNGSAHPPRNPQLNLLPFLSPTLQLRPFFSFSPPLVAANTQRALQPHLAPHRSALSPHRASRRIVLPPSALPLFPPFQSPAPVPRVVFVALFVVACDSAQIDRLNKLLKRTMALACALTMVSRREANSNPLDRWTNLAVWIRLTLHAAAATHGRSAAHQRTHSHIAGTTTQTNEQGREAQERPDQHKGNSEAAIATVSRAAPVITVSGAQRH